MARILLTSFYNECCPGLRFLKSYLQNKGHECLLVTLKVYVQISVKSAPTQPQYGEVHEVFKNDGWYYLGFSQKPTETEWNLWLEKITTWKADLVGMSVSSSNIRTAIEAAKRFKAASPNVPVIWGGPQPTIDPKGSLEHCDFTCIGEGELALADAAESLDRNEPLNSINNFAFKGKGGGIIINPLHPLIKDLDSLPFPDFDPETTYYIEGNNFYQKEYPPESQHHKFYLIQSSRGCPFDCSFCINSIYNDLYKNSPRVRRRSVENMIQELQEVKKRWGDIYLLVEDEIFTLDRKWLKEFCEEFKSRIKLPFWCYTHPNFCRQEEIEILKDAGLRYITLGIQSGSERINKDIYNRNIPNRKILDTLNMLDQLNVVTSCDLLTNNPFETEEDRISTFELMRNCPSKILLGLGKLIIYPGTPLDNKLKKTSQTPEVDELLYRFWNAAYIIALYGKPTDEEAQALLENEELRKHPEKLEEKAMELLKEISQKTEARLYEREEEVKKNLPHQKSSSLFQKLFSKTSN